MRAEKVSLGATSMNSTNAGALTPDPSPAIGRGGELRSPISDVKQRLQLDPQTGWRPSRVTPDWSYGA